MISRRILLFSVVVLAVLVSVLYASVIREARGASNGTFITINWSTTDESGVQRFELLRRSGYEGEFFFLGTVDAKGSNSAYEYIDKSVFKSTSGIYQYDIRAIVGDTPAQETIVTIAGHTSSTARRTWGSIKAMFR